MWPWHLDYLHEQGLLDEDEGILYFYSAGLWSISEDGNIVTTKGVVAYWTDVESGELFGDYAYYADIADISVAFAESGFEDTQITVVKRDGTEFLMAASAEEERDRIFVRAIEERYGGGGN